MGLSDIIGSVFGEPDTSVSSAMPVAPPWAEK